MRIGALGHWLFPADAHRQRPLVAVAGGSVLVLLVALSMVFTFVLQARTA